MNALPSRFPLPAAATHHAEDLVDGRYELLRPIAEGGMGEVFEARHVWSNRLVVVKTLRPDHIHRKDVADRLRRESEAIGRIAHPGVVTLLDAGHCRTHGPYLITERLEGRTLEGLLTSRGPLSVRGAMRMLRDLGAALGATHRQDVVHRDVKSANVFVARAHHGQGDVVKLIDFGIARIGRPEGGPQLTLAGGVLGTLSTMAPEQLVAPSAVDARADLYSLGVTILEALGADPGDVCARMSSKRLASRALASRSDVPAELVQLLDELCDPVADGRPRSAEQMLERLAAIPAPPGSDTLLGYGAEPTIEVHGESSFVGRRKHIRAPYLTPVRLAHEGRVTMARSEDISLGGMLIVTHRAAPAGARVTVRFAVPGTGVVTTVAGTVAWVKEQPGRTAIGVEFDELDEATHDAIACFLVAM